MRLDAAAQTADSDPMTLLRSALLAASCLSVLALAGCATPSGDQGRLATAPPPELAPPGASAYGLFLAGTDAFDSGDKASAARLYADAARKAPDQPLLGERAFLAALIAGDVSEAATLARTLDTDDAQVSRLAQLTQAVDAIAAGHGAEAEALLTKPPLTGPYTLTSRLLLPWAQAAGGDWKAALQPPAPTGERMTDDINALTYATLLERRHRFADADAVFRKLMSGGDSAGVYALSYGTFLERHGRHGEAIVLYKAALGADPSSNMISSALARANAGKAPPPTPTIAQGAAQTLLGPTVALLAAKQSIPGLAYLRLVLRLNPDQDEAWVLVGDALSTTNEPAGARDAYRRVSPESPEYVDARARLISTYDDDRSANPLVLQIAQETVKNAPGDDDALTLLADALRLNEQYAESAKVLDQLIANQGDKARWQLYYMRGVAFEQAGQWPAAEADMKKALALSPDQPDVLNYLGYSWVDRGENLKEAKAMIEKAVAAKPDSGAIVDSLGWVYFRLGDYSKAVDELEHAVELEPADPDINNHLGDAYWRQGRKTEARFQWERVLTLAPGEKLRAEVEGKLKTGMGAPAKVAQASQPAAR
jgi:tetratricopeptide (TPR) repeat protein